MDLKYSEEQQLLEDTVTRFVQERYDLKRRDAYLEERGGFSSDNWKTLADMGLLGLLQPENEGGFGGGPAETMIVLKALGRGLVVEPYWSSVILAQGLLGGHALASAIASGESLVAPALYEPGIRYDLDRMRSRVDDGVLTGSKSLVVAADGADVFLVAALAGTAQGTDDIGLFTVPADGPGVSIRVYPTQDGSRAGEVSFQDSPVTECVAQPGTGWSVLNAALDTGIAALCGECVGVAEVAFELTHEYLQTREQFGRPIGKFQVLQHALSDMRIAVEEISAMAISAAREASHPAPDGRARGISAAKVRIGEASRFVSQTAIQLHGGMGMTHEHAIGRYAKRLTTLEFLLGDVDYHCARFSRLMDA